MNTKEQLYAAIVAEPEDDTLRLAFADWLDENADEPCPHCGGGRPGTWVYAVSDGGRCDTCDGSLIVRKGRQDLAEFIRVQIELAKGPPACHCFMYGCDELFGDAEDVGCFKDWNRARRREKELQVDHPEWKTIPCDGCNRDRRRGFFYCLWCNNTGRLDRRRHYYERDTPDGSETVGEHRLIPVTLARGFIDAVECRYGDLLVASGPNTVPPVWLRAIVASAPVTRFLIRDKRPAHSGEGFFYWEESGTDPAYSVPPPLFSGLTGFTGESRRDGRRGDGTGNRQRHYRTADAATDALAKSACDWVRSFPLRPQG